MYRNSRRNPDDISLRPYLGLTKFLQNALRPEGVELGRWELAASLMHSIGTDPQKLKQTGNILDHLAKEDPVELRRVSVRIANAFGSRGVQSIWSHWLTTPEGMEAMQRRAEKEPRRQARLEAKRRHERAESRYRLQRNPHPPAEFPKYGLLDLSSLEGESKGHMSWAALQNVMKHEAKIGYSIVVKTGSDRNVHDLGTLRSAFDDIAFQLVRGQPVVIHFEPGFGERRPGYSLRVSP